MIDIYTPENIARSRARAASMRALVDEGKLEPEWRVVADEINAYADERERASGDLRRASEASMTSQGNAFSLNQCGRGDVASIAALETP